MTYAFDTLGYAKRLRDAGVSADAAEAHAEAAREFIMTELVTKQDLEVSRHTLELAMENMELRLERRIDEKIGAAENRLGGRIDGLEARLGSRIDGLETRVGSLEHRFDSLELHLTVRFGGMLAIAVAILAAVIKL
jgi:hypothetical protein